MWVHFVFIHTVCECTLCSLILYVSALCVHSYRMWVHFVFTHTVPHTTLLAGGAGAEARDTVFSYMLFYFPKVFMCKYLYVLSYRWVWLGCDWAQYTCLLFMSFSALYVYIYRIYIFIFCAFRKKGHKKKLNSYLVFGDILDMSQFLQQPGKCKILITFILWSVHRLVSK